MTCRTPLNRRLILTGFFGTALSVLSAAAPPGKGQATDVLPPLNRKVVEFARGRLGQKVANGQCTALVTEALRDAGASRFPFAGTGGDYVWGRPVGSFREAIPGDVVQFRDAVFRGKAWVTRRRWVSWHQEYPHHTAIVAGSREGGKIVVLLHQNVGFEGASPDQKETVTETTLHTDSLQKGGRVWIYRPVAPGDLEDEPVTSADRS